MSKNPPEAGISDSIGRLLHYGEIILELDQAAARLATGETTEEPLPDVKFVSHRHHYRLKGWVIQRED